MCWMTVSATVAPDGFTVLAIEDSPSVEEALNRFVRGEDEVLRQNDMNVMYSGRWLAEPMLLREYGVEPFNYQDEFILKNLTQEFDGVIFVKKSVSV